MNPDCLDYRLTEHERDVFNRDGYLILENTLSPETVDRLTGVVDGLHADGLFEEGRTDETIRGRVNKIGFVGMDRSLFDLVAYEQTLPKVWGILGWNIYLYHSHLSITETEAGTYQPDGPTWRWHQDSGRLNQDMETEPRPRISIKVAYFLTDVSEDGRGNFWVVPGSHLRNDIELPEGGMGQPEGAVPVLVKPGAAVIFDRRIWHTATPNFAPFARKVLFYGYGYRWIRTRDEMEFPQDWYDGSDPVLQQMLGHSTNEYGRSSPKDADVPLKVWLGKHERAAG
jgi:ectoine hydroxylase-related dioxygenase (phytanoyl-CoA dioxygenase family)